MKVNNHAIVKAECFYKAAGPWEGRSFHTGGSFTINPEVHDMEQCMGFQHFCIKDTKSW